MTLFLTWIVVEISRLMELYVTGYQTETDGKLFFFSFGLLSKNRHFRDCLGC